MQSYDLLGWVLCAVVSFEFADAIVELCTSCYEDCGQLNIDCADTGTTMLADWDGIRKALASLPSGNGSRNVLGNCCLCLNCCIHALLLHDMDVGATAESESESCCSTSLFRFAGRAYVCAC